MLVAMSKFQVASDFLDRHNKDIYASIFLVIFVAILYFPLLFKGQVFLDQEQIGFFYPISLFVSRSLQENTSLLWNNSYYGGVSASLDQVGGAFSPIHRFFLKYFDFFTAHHLSIFVATAIGTLFAYWFGKANMWLVSSSIVFAISYVLATTLTWLSIGIISAHSLITMPVMALAVLKIRNNGNLFFYVLVGASGFGLSLLAGFMQITFYIWPLMLLYAMFLDWDHRKTEAAWWIKSKGTISFLCMSGLGTLLGLKQLMPSVLLIDRTIRTSDYAIQNAVYPTGIELISFILPEYIKVPFLGGGSHGFYIGVLPVIFAILALLFYRTRTVVFFAAAYVIVLGFAFHVPVFSWVNEHIPPYRNMGGNFRWMVAGAFPLAFLGAAGLEGFLRSPEKISEKARKYLTKILAGISVLLLGGTLAVTYLLRYLKENIELQAKLIDTVFTGRKMTFTFDHYIRVLNQGIDNVLSILSIFNFEYIIPVLLWPLAFLIFYVWGSWSWLKKNIKFVSIALVSANAILIFFFQFDDLMIKKDLFTRKPRVVSFLESAENNPNEYRVMGFMLGDGLYREAHLKTPISKALQTDLQREYLINNSNLYWNIQRMDGMEPYRTMRHNRLIDTVISPERYAFVFDPDKLPFSKMNKLSNYDVLIPVSFEEKKKDYLMKLPILSMMNVKYIYSVYELNDPSLKIRYQDEFDLGEGLKLPLYLYENIKVMPRIYFASSPIRSHGDELALLSKISSTVDFFNLTWIECEECSEANLVRGEGSVSVNRYENGLVELTSESTTGGWLVFSESHMPGWVATVDGSEVPIRTANYLFQAIFVPRGVHGVRWEYHDVFDLYVKSLFKKINAVFASG